MIALFVYSAVALALALADLHFGRGMQWRDTAALVLLWPFWLALGIWLVAVAVLGGGPGDDDVEW